ncbi:MAG: sigma factor [Egibacteraceae bacterium]
MYGLAHTVVRDAAQAERAAEQALVEVWRHASRFDPARGSAIGWILAKAHRVAVDRARALRAAHQHHPVPRQPSVSHQRGESAVSLAYYDGYTVGEIAQLLDFPSETVAPMLRDGLRRLRHLAHRTGQ